MQIDWGGAEKKVKEDKITVVKLIVAGMERGTRQAMILTLKSN